MNGINIDTSISYYKNGKKKSSKSYNNQGKKHGLCETWREDGTRKDSTVHRNDTIIEEREYFTSGKVRQWFKKCLNARFVEAYFYHPDGTSAGKIVKGNGIVTGYTEALIHLSLITFFKIILDNKNFSCFLFCANIRFLIHSIELSRLLTIHKNCITNVDDIL